MGWQLIAGIGYRRILNVTRVEYYVFDVNNNGELEELAAAVVDARGYYFAYIAVAPGAYNLTAPIVLNLNNSSCEIKGLNTSFSVASGYNSDCILITSTGNLTNIKISDLTFYEKPPYMQLWNGLHIQLGNGQDLQMSSFENLKFQRCHTAIFADVTGTGWCNANVFQNIEAQAPIWFLRSTGSFGGNNFNIIKVQALNTITLGGIDLSGSRNQIVGYNFWDSAAGIYGITFQATALYNFVKCSDVGIGGINDLSTYGANRVEANCVNGTDINARNSSLDIANVFQLSPKYTGNIDPAIGITQAMLAGFIYYNGGAAVDITANPQIAAGRDGQVIIIMGGNAVNTLTLDHGTGLSLAGGVSFVLASRDMIMLMYSTNQVLWIEISRSNNA